MPKSTITIRVTLDRKLYHAARRFCRANGIELSGFMRVQLESAIGTDDDVTGGTWPPDAPKGN